MGVEGGVVIDCDEMGTKSEVGRRPNWSGVGTRHMQGYPLVVCNWLPSGMIHNLLLFPLLSNFSETENKPG